MIEILQIVGTVLCCFGGACLLASVIVNGLEHGEDEL
jgi:hypothetical protein